MSQNTRRDSDFLTAQTVVSEDIGDIVEQLGSEASLLEGAVVLMTGGAGFLGSYITGALQQLNRDVLRRPCKIIVVDNFFTSSGNNLFGMVKGPDVTLLERDVRAPFDIDGPVDYVIHAAGIPSPIYYKEFPIETIETGVWGAKHQLELAKLKQSRSFMFFSSSEIYGDPDPRFIPIPESYRGNVSCVGPRSCYDESKRLGEALCMAYFHRYNMPVKTVRPFNVYGPGMKRNDYRVIPAFLNRAIESKPLQVYSQGSQTRAFCYVTDAIVGFLKVLLRGTPGDAYNVGNDQEELPMTTLAERVAGLFDNTMVERVEYPAGYPTEEPLRRFPDLTKMRTELQYRPRVELADGLRRTCAWYMDVPARGKVALKSAML